MTKNLSWLRNNKGNGKQVELDKKILKMKFEIADSNIGSHLFVTGAVQVHLSWTKFIPNLDLGYWLNVWEEIRMQCWILKLDAVVIICLEIERVRWQSSSKRRMQFGRRQMEMIRGCLFLETVMEGSYGRDKFGPVAAYSASTKEKWKKTKKYLGPDNRELRADASEWKEHLWLCTAW